MESRCEQAGEHLQAAVDHQRQYEEVHYNDERHKDDGCLQRGGVVVVPYDKTLN